MNDPPPGGPFHNEWTCPDCGKTIHDTGWAKAGHRKSNAHIEAVNNARELAAEKPPRNPASCFSPSDDDKKQEATRPLTS